MPDTLPKAQEIVDIPIELIRENPDNVRGPESPEEKRKMADSLLAAGQHAAVLVRPQTEAEKAQYPPTQYLLLGGHRRFGGAQMAGLKAVRALITNPSTPFEELKLATLDNRSKPLNWWEWDLLIEKFLKLDPGLKQNQLADELDLSTAKINYALKITKVLNPASRELVRQNLAAKPKDADEEIKSLNQNSKDFVLIEAMLLALAELGDSQEVEKGLRVVLEKKMRLPEVRQWVAGQKGGQDPETSTLQQEADVQRKNRKSAPPNPATSTPSGAIQAGIRGTPTTDTEPPKPNTSWGDRLGSLLPKPHEAKSLIVGGVAGAVGGFLVTNLKRTLSTFTRRWMLHGLVALGAIGFFGFHWYMPRNYSTAPRPKALTQEAPQVPDKGQNLASNTTNAALPVNPTPFTADTIPVTWRDSYWDSKVPAKWKARVRDTRHLVNQFTWAWFGADYSDMKSVLDGVTKYLDPTYAPGFMSEYFPSSKVEKIGKLKLIELFINNTPPQIMALDATSETYLIPGRILYNSDLYKPDQKVSEGPITLEVHVRHNPEDGDSGKVVWVKASNDVPVPDFVPIPPKAQNQGSGEDLGKKVVGGVQDISDTAKSVDNTVSAVDQARKALGF